MNASGFVTRYPKFWEADVSAESGRLAGLRGGETA